MYSQPIQDARKDQKTINDMQRLLAAGWQRLENGQWLAPDDDTPVPTFVALQSIELITHADEAMVIEAD